MKIDVPFKYKKIDKIFYSFAHTEKPWQIPESSIELLTQENAIKIARKHKWSSEPLGILWNAKKAGEIPADKHKDFNHDDNQ